MQREISIALVAGLLAPVSTAQCDDWLEGFTRPVVGPVAASTKWSTGGTDRLVLAYGTDHLGLPVPGSVIAWDGSDFDTLGGGLIGESRALATFDDGGGTALYVGGVLTSTVVGGVWLRNIARWDGSNWSNVLGGVTGPNKTVNALAVFDDGSGPALYVAGRFTAAGGIPGVPVNNIARWNGSSWSSVGNGLNGSVLSLAVFDDGAGAKLYAGRGPGSTKFLSVWDGASWSAVTDAPDAPVHALAALDLGAGERLFVGGDFTAVGSQSAARVASWDGSSWTSYGAGLPARVLAFSAYNTGSGLRLQAGGEFVLGAGAAVAEWDSAQWTGLDGGDPIAAPPHVQTLREFTLGLQRVLVAGGRSGLRYLHQGLWRSIAPVPTHNPQSIVDFDDGAGAAPFSISNPPFAAAVPGVPVVWKYEQMQWSRVPGSPYGLAYKLLKFDDGNGERLFVGGSLTTLTGALANDVQVYDGSTWSPVGALPDFAVRDLEWFDAGAGPRLYAAGSPGGPSGNPTIPGFVICWDGVSWSAIGGPTAPCLALERFGNGAGTKLYVGGSFGLLFPATGSPGLATWDGTTWARVATGLQGSSDLTVQALARWDDGTGEKLYIGGAFSGAGGVPNTVNIASWNGTNFAPLGIGWSYDVKTLAVDTGTAPSTLVAGGTYSTLPSLNGLRERGGLMRWDGSSWSHYEGGLDQSSFSQNGSSVRSVVVADLGDGVDILVTGGFQQLGDTFSAGGVGVWNRCAAPGEPYCFGSGVDTICACLNASPVEEQSGCVNSSGRAALLRGDGSASIAQNDLSLRTHGMPPAKSCILFVGTDAPNGGAGALFDD
ncbi:MAG: hypothetical protein JNN27_20660, partial [Planctomycetes bacterium]|nr:hypothetical protein [Planctomycetota bacterium]